MPDEDQTLRGSLLHDLSIITEKVGNRDNAVEFGRQSAALFAGANLPEAQVQTLDLVGGMLARGGDQGTADAVLLEARNLRTEHNLDTIVVSPLLRATRRITNIDEGGRSFLGRIDERVIDITDTTAAPDATPLVLLGTRYLTAAPVERRFTVLGEQAVARITLDGDGAAGIKTFLTELSDTVDLGLVTNF